MLARGRPWYVTADSRCVGSSALNASFTVFARFAARVLRKEAAELREILSLYGALKG
jgi:hypothetical protein